MTQLTNRAAFSDRVRGLFFDFLACGVETTSGWRTLHSSLPTVLAEAVIPSLALTSADRELWQDDEDEFIRRHVEDEGSDALVFHEECVTARRSAMNFVAVLAAREARDAAASKPGAGAGAKKKGRKRGRKRAEAAKSKHLQDCISQLIASVTGTTDEKPSASKRRRSGGDDREGAFALESKHYALLMVVGASSRNLGLKPAMVCPPSSVVLALLLSAHLWLCDTQIASLIEDVVLPACVEDFAPEYPVSTIPALQAASMWLLSRVAEHVPARLVMKSFTRSVGLMNVADKETEDGMHGNAEDVVKRTQWELTVFVMRCVALQTKSPGSLFAFPRQPVCASSSTTSSPAQCCDRTLGSWWTSWQLPQPGVRC